MNLISNLIFWSLLGLILIWMLIKKGLKILEVKTKLKEKHRRIAKFYEKFGLRGLVFCPDAGEISEVKGVVVNTKALYGEESYEISVESFTTRVIVTVYIFSEHPLTKSAANVLSDIKSSPKKLQGQGIRLILVKVPHTSGIYYKDAYGLISLVPYHRIRRG